MPGRARHCPCLGGFSPDDNVADTPTRHAVARHPPNKISFDRHSSLMERTQRSECAFKFGLLAGSGVHSTPPAASVSRKLATELLVAIVQQVTTAVQISGVLHRGVARDLFHPPRVRMARNAAQPYAAAAYF